MTSNKITSISDIKRANAEADFCFFSPETMAFFASRVYAEIYPDETGSKIYFVTSEKTGFDDASKRMFTVRYFDVATAEIETEGEYGQYRDLEDAQEWARACAGIEEQTDVEEEIGS